MRIIKNNRKVFVGVIIGAALIAIIPTILVYMLSKMLRMVDLKKI